MLKKVSQRLGRWFIHQKMNRWKKSRDLPSISNTVWTYILSKITNLSQDIMEVKMCVSKEPKSQFEDIQELKNKIKILSKKVISIKPELKDWVKKNFVDSWRDSEEE